MHVVAHRLSDSLSHFHQLDMTSILLKETEDNQSSSVSSPSSSSSLCHEYPHVLIVKEEKNVPGPSCSKLTMSLVNDSL